MKVCNAARLGYVHDAIVGDTQVTFMHYELLWMGFVHSDAVADPCTMPVLNGTAPVCTRCHSQSDPPTPQRSHFTLLYPWPLPSSPPIPTSPPHSMHICVTHNHVPMPPHPRRCYLNSSGSDGSTGFPPILHGSPSPQQHRCPPTPNLGMGMWQTQGIGGFSAPFCWWGGSIPPFSPPIFPLFPPSFIPPPPQRLEVTFGCITPSRAAL